MSVTDLNADGLRNTDDTAHLAALLAQSQSGEIHIGDPLWAPDADLNFDGVIDNADMTALAALPGAEAVVGALWPRDDTALRGLTIGYAGAPYDREARASLMRNRWYSPTLGRFISRDPAGYIDGMSLYQYVTGNPLKYWDPFGLEKWGCFDGWLTTAKYAVFGAPEGVSGPSVGQGFAEGATGGLNHTVNSATGGLTDAVGLTNTANYQDDIYNVSKVSGVVIATVSPLKAGAAANVAVRTSVAAGRGLHAANAAQGVASAGQNIAQGNPGAAAIDLVGAVLGRNKGNKGTRQAGGGADDLVGVARGEGRTGRQTRLRSLADDPNVSSADRGWLRQEMNQIERGTRKSIRNPPGKLLAHPRGREAAKGYSHTEAPSHLQDISLHRLQHKYDNFGKRNPRRE